MKQGVLYCISNKIWDNVFKIGSTCDIKKRISCIQTSLYEDCVIECQTNNLKCINFFEHIVKHIILKNYKLRKDREFYKIEVANAQQIFETFNIINEQMSEEQIIEYMRIYLPDYYKRQKKVILSNKKNIVEKKLKKRKRIYVDIQNEKIYYV